MVRKAPSAAFSAVALVLAGCGPGLRAQGSEAIADFLGAVQRGDERAFETGVDRSAVRSDLRQQLAALGKTRGVDVDGGASDLVLDRMITPQAVRQAAARVQSGWPAAPTAAQITPHMKVVDRHHVCLEEAASHGCLLSFALEDSTWRLTALRFSPPAGEAPAAGS
jgi:hypothetical protein